MGSEFTGERVVPGEVDIDLWNEHLARYAFATRLARRRRVLDIGCGVGYGSAELAKSAESVVGIDISPEAIAHAREQYQARNLSFETGSADSLPLPDGSFDLVVAFEVIEHLENWQALLSEASRVLSPGGQFVVSTPNRAYYAETRARTGPNPFHVHEFEYDEFAAALAAVFPHTLLFTENHAESIVFRPIANQNSSAAEVRIETADKTEATADAHFYLAVCALQPMTGAPAFLYVPSSANVLRERERHIQRLQSELAQKDEWLRESQTRHADLVKLHHEQTEELKRQNRWALEVDEQLRKAGERVSELQDEITRQHEAAMAELDRLEKERLEAIEWARKRESELQAELETTRGQITEVIALLDKAEETVVERTLWAQSLDAEANRLREQLGAVGGSRWVKLGRKLGVGPRVG